jgi:hypothetical protein
MSKAPAHNDRALHYLQNWLVGPDQAYHLLSPMAALLATPGLMATLRAIGQMVRRLSWLLEKYALPGLWILPGSIEEIDQSEPRREENVGLTPPSSIPPPPLTQPKAAKDKSSTSHQAPCAPLPTKERVTGATSPLPRDAAGWTPAPVGPVGKEIIQKKRANYGQGQEGMERQESSGRLLAVRLDLRPTPPPEKRRQQEETSRKTRKSIAIKGGQERLLRQLVSDLTLRRSLWLQIAPPLADLGALSGGTSTGRSKHSREVSLPTAIVSPTQIGPKGKALGTARVTQGWTSVKDEITQKQASSGQAQSPIGSWGRSSGTGHGDTSRESSMRELRPTVASGGTFGQSPRRLVKDLTLKTTLWLQTMPPLADLWTDSGRVSRQGGGPGTGAPLPTVIASLTQPEAGSVMAGKAAVKDVKPAMMLQTTSRSTDHLKSQAFIPAKSIQSPRSTKGAAAVPSIDPGLPTGGTRRQSLLLRTVWVTEQLNRQLEAVLPHIGVSFRPARTAGQPGKLPLKAEQVNEIFQEIARLPTQTSMPTLKTQRQLSTALYHIQSMIGHRLDPEILAIPSMDRENKASGQPRLQPSEKKVAEALIQLEQLVQQLQQAQRVAETVDQNAYAAYPKGDLGSDSRALSEKLAQLLADEARRYGIRIG